MNGRSAAAPDVAVIVTPFLAGIGVVLVLGGLGHSAGVIHLYATSGVPDANRVLLDIWIAEAQLVAGGLYVAAFRARRVGSPWRAMAAFGALITIGYAVPMLPVLFARAPFLFRVPTMVYLAVSVFVLARAAGSG
jgi:hypothetical protein